MVLVRNVIIIILHQFYLVADYRAYPAKTEVPFSFSLVARGKNTQGKHSRPHARRTRALFIEKSTNTENVASFCQEKNQPLFKNTKAEHGSLCIN